MSSCIDDPLILELIRPPVKAQQKGWAAETLAHWDAREKEVLAREEVWKAEEREWREEASALIHAGVYIGWLLGYAQGILDMVHALARNRNSA